MPTFKNMDNLQKIWISSLFWQNGKLWKHWDSIPTWQKQAGAEWRLSLARLICSLKSPAESVHSFRFLSRQYRYLQSLVGKLWNLILEVRLGIRARRPELEGHLSQMGSLYLVQWARGRIEQCLLSYYHCVTNHHKIQWLKTAIVYLDHDFVNGQFGLAQLRGCSGLDWNHLWLGQLLGWLV